MVPRRRPRRRRAPARLGPAAPTDQALSVCGAPHRRQKRAVDDTVRPHAPHGRTEAFCGPDARFQCPAGRVPHRREGGSAGRGSGTTRAIGKRFAPADRHRPFTGIVDAQDVQLAAPRGEALGERLRSESPPVGPRSGREGRCRAGRVSASRSGAAGPAPRARPVPLRPRPAPEGRPAPRRQSSISAGSASAATGGTIPSSLGQARAGGGGSAAGHAASSAVVSIGVSSTGPGASAGRPTRWS